MARRSFLAPLIALALVAAACGGGGDDDETSTGGEGGGAPTTAVGGVETDELDREATLRLMYTVAPTSLDPHRGSSSTDNTTLNLVYDRLVHVTPEGDAIPGLAVEWELEMESPALLMTLREGVTFHDGTPFDADAVKANIERAKGETSNVKTDLALVSSVDVVSPTQVRLNLTEPSSALPLVLSDRGGMMISPAAFDKPDLDRAPVGAGMYRVTDYEVGVRVDFERYEQYWEPEAAAAAAVELIFQADDTTRLNAIRDGQVDWTNLSSLQLAEARDAGLEIDSGPDLAFYHLQMNISRSEFGDIRVRQALNHAVDREGMLQAIFGGQGEVNIEPFPKGYFAYDPSVEDLYPYDPERAKELLAEAGLADGFEFELLTAQLDTFVKVSEALQAQLEQVGIRTTIRVVPVNEVVQRAYLDKVGDAVMITFQGRPDPSQSLGRLYAEGGPTNASGISTPAFMDAYTAMMTETEPEARAEALRKVTGTVVTEALDVPLLNAFANYATQPNVANFEPYITAKPEFRNVGIAAE